MNRRGFLGAATCGAHVLTLACFSPSLLRQAFANSDDREIEAKEKWGRLEKVHDGVWALISTPFTSRDFTTVCNGGIIQGEKGVLAIESFMQPAGATWIAEQAKRLTGSWPTDVVSTHYHADHSGGHRGYFKDGQSPRMWLTDATKNAAEKSFKERSMEGNSFRNVSSIDPKRGATIDLGNRQVKLVPRSGHTDSDVTIELVEPKVVWCGDLFFNRMFPNYSDAIPSRLNKYVASISAAPDVTYVPGHGPIADVAALETYKEFLGFIEQRATEAYQAGRPVEAETKEFKLPERFAKWLVWSPENAKNAFNAWYRELGPRREGD